MKRETAVDSFKILSSAVSGVPIASTSAGDRYVLGVARKTLGTSSGAMIFIGTAHLDYHMSCGMCVCVCVCVCM